MGDVREKKTARNRIDVYCSWNSSLTRYMSSTQEPGALDRTRFGELTHELAEKLADFDMVIKCQLWLCYVVLTVDLTHLNSSEVSIRAHIRGLHDHAEAVIRELADDPKRDKAFFPYLKARKLEIEFS